MNNLDIVILGALKEKPQCIGEIQRNIKNRNIHKIAHFSLTNVYSTMKKLEIDGLVIGENKRRGNRTDIIIYNITKSGEKYFEEAIEGRCKNPQLNIFTDINYLIVNMEFIDDEKKIEYYKNIKNKIIEKKDSIIKSKVNKSYVDELIIKQQIKLLNALEEWIEEAKEDIVKK